MNALELPSVENLVGLLSLYAPTTLETLKKRHPEVNIFEPGKILGPSRTGTWKAALDVALEGLQKMVPLIEPALDKMNRRLRIAGRVELVGELLGAVGSGSVIAVLWPERTAHASLGAIIAALVAFLGTAGAIIVRFIRRDIFGGENAIFKQYENLRDSGWSAKLLTAQLLGLSEADEETLESEENRELITRADDLAKRIYTILIDLGIKIGQE